MSYFRLKDCEIDTLPYITFDDEHNPMIPGRSYGLGNLHTLVSRKYAFLAGLDPGVSLSSQEVEFLKRGWQLFEAECVHPHPPSPSSTRSVPDTGPLFVCIARRS